MADTSFVNVFTYEGQGGNPCPIMMDAQGLSKEQMQDVARRYGHEASFVLPPESPDQDFVFRFFVPNHEMEMCGHATIGTLWLLAREGRLTGEVARISTLSGPVTGYIGRSANGEADVEITQPVGKVTPLTAEEERAVLAALGIGRDALIDAPIYNAVTSRVKTLIPLKDPERLNALTVDTAAIAAVCGDIGSTGLYPFAGLDEAARTFEARQFPRASGYPEDAATGIAAAALAFGFLRDARIAADDRPIRVLQGRAMGSLSEIRLRIGFAQGRPVGCLLGGAVSQRS